MAKLWPKAELKLCKDTDNFPSFIKTSSNKEIARNSLTGQSKDELK